MWRQKSRRFLQYSHPAACLLLVILLSWGLLSSDPMAVVRRSPFSILTTISDLIMHCGAYALLSTLVLTFAGSIGRTDLRRTLVILMVVHSIGTELAQFWIPRRTCDPLDAMANFGGIFVGAAIASWLLNSNAVRWAFRLGSSSRP